MPNWVLLEQPNVYGYVQRYDDNWKAEVVRAYQNDWRVYVYHNEYMVRVTDRVPSYSRSYPTHLRAKEAASAIVAALRGDS